MQARQGARMGDASINPGAATGLPNRTVPAPDAGYRRHSKARAQLCEVLPGNYRQFAGCRPSAPAGTGTRRIRHGADVECGA